jgi:hypothetical protein
MKFELITSFPNSFIEVKIIDFLTVLEFIYIFRETDKFSDRIRLRKKFSHSR